MTDATRDDPSSITADAVAASLARGDGGLGREQRSYYDHPVLRKTHWGWEVVWYFYVGGLMSGSALLSCAADTFGDDDDRGIVRAGRCLALAGSLAGPALLIKDLGRPERFLNMLRVLNPKSPMSVGVWSLSGFALLSGIAALEELRGRGRVPWLLGGFLPRGARNLFHACAAAFAGSYTGVLIAATAIPVWNAGRRHIPAIFALSAVSTACAAISAVLAFTGGSPKSANKLAKIHFVASLAQGALLVDYAAAAGGAGAALFGGQTGERLRAGTLVGGIAIPACLNFSSVFTAPARAKRRGLLASLLVAGLTLYGGYVLRKSLVDAGRSSADDVRSALHQPD